jgi:hypothetical protein
LSWWLVDQTCMGMPAVSQVPATTAEDSRRVLDRRAVSRRCSSHRRFSGKDPQVARAEVWRIVHQLTPLDERVRRLDGDRPGAPRGADREEFAAAAAALVGYYLAGRRTDDELLGEVEAAWAEHEDLAEQWRQRAVGGGTPARRRAEPTVERREQVVTDRYLVAWRRWFDRQAQQGARVGLTDP